MLHKILDMLCHFHMENCRYMILIMQYHGLCALRDIEKVNDQYSKSTFIYRINKHGRKSMFFALVH